MKIFLTKLKNKIVLISFLFLIFINLVMANPVSQVVEIKGQVFRINDQGKTIALKKEDHIDEKSEVLVEEGASVTLNDYYDGTYHLIGGSHIKIFDKSIQLKKGKAWIQSKNDKYLLSLTSANGLVEFKKSEFIVTFDQGHSKTQVLVVNGEVDFSNVLDKNHRQTVAAGTFTFIDPKVEDGLPRPATKIGLHSLNLALSEFKGLPQEIKKTNPLQISNPKRGIASDSRVVEEKVEIKKPKRGQIIFVKTNRMPASVSAAIPTGEAHGYYSKVLKNLPKKSITKKSSFKEEATVPVRFFGLSNNKNIKNTEQRLPASIPVKTPEVIAPKKELEKIEDQAFDESLQKHQKEQPKYSKELESLINDLKSF